MRLNVDARRISIGHIVEISTNALFHPFADEKSFNYIYVYKS